MDQMWESMLLHFHFLLDPADVRAREQRASHISRLLATAETVEEKTRLLREKPWRINPPTEEER